jgi:hypothetical protein
MVASDKKINISEELRRAFLSGEDETVSVGDIVQALGPRSFGLGIMIFLIPICIPMPPGIPMAVGMILGFLLILPIPIVGNVLPAISGTVLALGLTDRDGLVFICGFVASMIAIAVTILMAVGMWSPLNFTF